MSKILHIRDVPAEVHDALVRSARDEGLSLTRYMQRELARLARRSEAARANVDIIRRARADIGATLEREVVQQALDEGRRR